MGVAGGMDVRVGNKKLLMTPKVEISGCQLLKRREVRIERQIL